MYAMIVGRIPAVFISYILPCLRIYSVVFLVVGTSIHLGAYAATTHACQPSIPCEKDIV